MLAQKFVHPAENIVSMLEYLRLEAKNANLGEVAFMIELAMTAARDAAAAGGAGQALAPQAALHH